MTLISKTRIGRLPKRGEIVDIFVNTTNMYPMAVRVVEFLNGGYKIRKIIEEKSTYPKETIEF